MGCALDPLSWDQALPSDPSLSAESAWDSFSFFLCPLPLVHMPTSLSQINKLKKKKRTLLWLNQ